jgi:hypothetical protein
MNYHVYLFEMKSIQAYITRTGRLRDLTNLSDLLDSIIDEENQASVLESVITAIDPDKELKFIRRGGGAIHLYSANREKVLRFRSVWTLLFSQLVPGMTYTDCMTEVRDERDNLSKDLSDAFIKLNSSINAPSVSLPYATAIVQASSRTGLADVLVSGDANISKSERDDTDLSTLRTSYPLRYLRKNLYLKFLKGNGGEDKNEALANSFKNRFDSLINELDNGNSDDSSRDIAYVHFDGNSVGKTIIGLRNSISNYSLSQQAGILKAFSEVITKSTTEAVSEALMYIYKDLAFEKDFIFRPLVLGGDDVTLLIEPRYALPFCQKYCGLFEQKTKKAIKAFTSDNNVCIGVEKLTASGGILFNKINHPAINTHQIVEQLAEKAKYLTKHPENPEDTSPSAVAFFRLSTTSSDSLDTIFKRGRVFTVEKNRQINVGDGCYYIDKHKSKTRTDVESFIALLEAIRDSQKEKQTSVVSKFRAMLTCIAQGSMYEADRIYRNLMEKQHINKNLKERISVFFGSVNKWYYETGENGESYRSPIADLIVMAHYMDQGDGACDTQNQPD